jgi:hypothetical protein
LRRDGDTIEVVNGYAPPDRVHETIWKTMQTLLAGDKTV